MPAINLEIIRQSHALTAAFYAEGIVCPPLIAYNDWLLAQLGAETTQTSRASGKTADFDAALTSALESSPDGIDMNDLRAVLAPYRQTPQQIGAALGRAKRLGKVEQKGDLWFLKTGTIDRRLNTGSRGAPRRAGDKVKGTEAGGEAEREPMAATG